MPVTQEFIESLMKQNQMQLEQSSLTRTLATAPNRHHLTVSRKSTRVCARKAARNAEGRRDIKEPILLFLPSLTKSIGICTPIVPHVLTGISALQRLMLRKHGTSLTL